MAKTKKPNAEERRALWAESLNEAASDLKKLICGARDEGYKWDEISQMTKLPGYVCMVVAGETRGNRPLPEYAQRRGR